MKVKARIYRSSQRTFECKILETGEMVSAVALGNLLKGGEVVVGDYVLLEEGAGGGNGERSGSGSGPGPGSSVNYLITEVEPRKNEIFRMIVREAKKKVNAANCDIMVIVMSASFPAYKRGLLDRYLVRAYQWGITPAVVFNKMDEYDQDQEPHLDLEFEVNRLKFLNLNCFAISALEPEKIFFGKSKSFQDLKVFLQGKTAIFMGPSGVGKSRIISSLTGGEVNLLSQELGKVQKGTHTTTWSELVECRGFHLIDSPGIRSFSLDDVASEDLSLYFPDLMERALQCKFPNCGHDDSAVGCAFHDKEKVTEENRELLLSRLKSFHQILTEVSQRPSWEKEK